MTKYPALVRDISRSPDCERTPGWGPVAFRGYLSWHKPCSFARRRGRSTKLKVTLPLSAPRGVPDGKPARLVLINPPALAGRTNERTYSGGIGVSRKLKPFEKDRLEVLPIDFLYLAAVAEKAGAVVT